MLSYLLHEDGVDLNGVTLLSSILDYSQAGNPVGLLPTWAAMPSITARSRPQPPPADLASFAEAATRFAATDYAAALQAFPKADPATVRKLSAMIGIDETMLTSWSLERRRDRRSGHGPVPAHAAEGRGAGARLL